MKLAQAIVQGLEVGGFYAVLASGLTLIFGIMNVVNVAHGALLVLAGLFTFELWRRTGIDPLLTIVLTTPVMFYLVIMVVLLVRPHGLLGERLREDVAQ